MDAKVRWDLILKERFDELLLRRQYAENHTQLETDTEIIDQIKYMAIARIMLSVFEKERAAGQCTLFEKVNNLDEIVCRYTVLMFYLRRLEFDIMDDSLDAFNQFLIVNQVSRQELFAVMYCGNIDKERVLQIIKDKMINGEILV